MQSSTTIKTMTDSAMEILEAMNTRLEIEDFSLRAKKSYDWEGVQFIQMVYRTDEKTRKDKWYIMIACHIFSNNVTCEE